MPELLPRRRYPCSECPWRRDVPPGQFPACRYDALRSTSDQSGLTAPMFGCHKGEPGTNADLACAGWLAVAGIEHLGVRMAVLTGRLEPADLAPGDGWPELFASYAEMAAAQEEPVPERFLVRTEGGPCDGETRIAAEDAGWEWPLPGRLLYGPEGAYVKTGESDLPPQDDASGVLRGATYRWESADA